MESLPTFPPNANQTELPPSIGDTPEYMIIDDPPNLAAASGPAPSAATKELPPFEGETPEYFTHNDYSNEEEKDSTDVNALPEDGFTYVAKAEDPPEDTDLPEDGLTNVAEEEAEDVDNDHDHDHDHEDGIAGHTHDDGTIFDHSHEEDGPTSWNEDTSKVGDMDPDKIIPGVPPPPPPMGDAAGGYIPVLEYDGSDNPFETKAGDPAMDNMIVRPEGESSSSQTTVPTDMNSLEAEMENFLNGEMEEIEGTTAGDSTTVPPTDLDSIEAAMEDVIDESVKEWNEVGEGTHPPTDLDSIEAGMEDFIDESVKEWDSKGNSTAIASGDEDDGEDGDESEDADAASTDDDEDADESSDDDDEDGDSDSDEGLTQQVEEATTVPTDLESIEAEMTDFIDESIKEWNAKGNATAVESGDGKDLDGDDGEEEEDEDGDSDEDSDEDGEESEDDDGDEEDQEDEDGDESEDSDESSEDEDADDISPNEDNVGVEGSPAIKPPGAEGKKDGIEEMLDDDGTKSALFGTPTLAPTGKMVWNDAAPVFKPELPATQECSLSSYSIQACMKNTYVLGGVGSILLLLLLCICRKCCCRSSRADERGQYRQVAAQYGDMKYDNTFSDDYSAGSAGDIELSLAEMNG
ncbi:unnamed protein product [Cylindrotheca closterium]|uniref:Uncharacterized protein n=1 Tax=Cylindrotheca closterium TaxID=2856 RepID=A0AAD2JMU4_9STRA|nr:unnamed protein product [Cylindrotheca closterium]